MFMFRERGPRCHLRRVTQATPRPWECRPSSPLKCRPHHARPPGHHFNVGAGRGLCLAVTLFVRVLEEGVFGFPFFEAFDGRYRFVAKTLFGGRSITGVSGTACDSDLGAESGLWCVV